MKILLLGVALLLTIITSAQIAISSNNAQSDPSAMLDVQSTQRGMLVPRMTMQQRNLIQSPATSLLIYQVDNTPGFYFNAGTPATPNWLSLQGAASNNAFTDLPFRPFSMQDKSLVIQRLYNNAFTVPAGKTFCLYEINGTYVSSSSDLSLRVNGQIVNSDEGVIIPSGKTLSVVDTSVTILGYLFNESNIQGVFMDIKNQTYTVPAGKTFYMTAYFGEPIDSNGFYLQPFYINGVYINLGNVDAQDPPQVYPAGTTLKGNGIISGYLK
jgi:hypothetical protein